MSVPCGFSKAGTPIGMQIAAGPFQVDLIFTLLTPTNRRLSGTSGDQHNSIEIANNNASRNQRDGLPTISICCGF